MVKRPLAPKLPTTTRRKDGKLDLSVLIHSELVLSISLSKMLLKLEFHFMVATWRLILLLLHNRVLTSSNRLEWKSSLLILQVDTNKKLTCLMR